MMADAAEHETQRNDMRILKLHDTKRLTHLMVRDF